MSLRKLTRSISEEEASTFPTLHLVQITPSSITYSYFINALYCVKHIFESNRDRFSSKNQTLEELNNESQIFDSLINQLHSVADDLKRNATNEINRLHASAKDTQFNILQFALEDFISISEWLHLMSSKVSEDFKNSKRTDEITFRTISEIVFHQINLTLFLKSI
jgi:hypothetical protein